MRLHWGCLLVGVTAVIHTSVLWLGTPPRHCRVTAKNREAPQGIDKPGSWTSFSNSVHFQPCTLPFTRATHPFFVALLLSLLPTFFLSDALLLFLCLTTRRHFLLPCSCLVVPSWVTSSFSALSFLQIHETRVLNPFSFQRRLHSSLHFQNTRWLQPLAPEGDKGCP